MAASGSDRYPVKWSEPTGDQAENRPTDGTTSSRPGPRLASPLSSPFPADRPTTRRAAITTIERPTTGWAGQAGGRLDPGGSAGWIQCLITRMERFAGKRQIAETHRCPRKTNACGNSKKTRKKSRIFCEIWKAVKNAYSPTPMSTPPKTGFNTVF